MNVPLQYYPAPRVKSAKEKAHDRVREEKKELDRKYTALYEFLDDPSNFNKIDSIESGLLYEQCNAMKHYREAITARIEYWETE